MNSSDTQFAQSYQPLRCYSRGERIGLLFLGLFLSALLTVAVWLKPNPAGLGTHTQLGLPGCTMFTLLGVRCPGCGMTTAWAHTMNGDLASAIQANVGGVLLCFLSIIAAPVLIWLAIRGKPIASPWSAQFAIASLVVAVSISFIEWMIRLAF